MTARHKRCMDSPLRGPDARRPAAHLERPGGFELLAVEAQDLDFHLDHALDQEGLAVLAPGRALAPMGWLPKLAAVPPAK